MPLGLTAEAFTIECWFKWDGGGVTTATSGWPHDPTDTGGIEAYPLITKGVVDREYLTPTRNVNYFLGILERGVLAADFEEASTGSSPGQNHPVTPAAIPSRVNCWHGFRSSDAPRQ